MNIAIMDTKVLIGAMWFIISVIFTCIVVISERRINQKPTSVLFWIGIAMIVLSAAFMIIFGIVLL